jgi:hypothetical protein
MSSKWKALPIMAVLACVAITPTAASAGESGWEPLASAAKKKCKKKGKKGKKKSLGASAAKKKCKKKKKAPVPLPPPGPIVRASITWAEDVDVDLHAYDPLGRHAGYESSFDAIVQGIPDGIHSPDAITAGTESFIDNVFVLGSTANRAFSYVICFRGTATVQATSVQTGTGVPAVESITRNSGQAVQLTPPGSFTPPETACGP